MEDSLREQLERQFLDLTDSLERVYDTTLLYEDEEETMVIGYICPHCNDCVYFEDWIVEYSLGQDMDMCPICEDTLEVD